MPRWAKLLFCVVALDTLVWLAYAGLEWHDRTIQDCQNGYVSQASQLAQAWDAALQRKDDDFSVAEDVLTMSDRAAVIHLNATVLSDSAGDHLLPLDATRQDINDAQNANINRDLKAQSAAFDKLTAYRDTHNPKELCS